MAELSHEVGVAGHMSYDCDGSFAYMENMIHAFEDHYRYHLGIEMLDRIDSTADAWFATIQRQINANRPTQHRIGDNTVDPPTGHFIVCDGWQEILPDTRQYHMNYGWDDANSTWYTLDALYGNSGPDQEIMLVYIYPMNSIGHEITGEYPQPGFPYRYFDMEAS